MASNKLKLSNNNNANLVAQNTQGELISRTLSYCSICFKENDKSYRPASIIEENSKIWLQIECPKHSQLKVLYCKSADFYKKILLFGARPQTTAPDIEDINRRIEGVGNGANRPLIFTITLYENNKFISKEEIEHAYHTFKLQHNKEGARPGISFIIKLDSGKFCMDLNTLNSLALMMVDLHKGVIVFESTYDRLILISRLENSIFKCSDVYPAVNYSLRFGDENLCITELQKLHRNLLAEFEGLSIMCTIMIDRSEQKYPYLEELFAYLREFPNFFRFVQISFYRSSSSSSSDDGSDDSLSMSSDPYSFLEYFESQTAISPLQFFPGTASLVMEPILNSLGFGNFSLKISPFCSFVVPLINTDTINSVPLGEYFDVESFYHNLLPLLPQLRTNSIGPILVKKLTKIFKTSSRKSTMTVTDFISLVTSKSNEKITNFSKNLQFIVIHNNMDYTSFDIIRRCYCASAQLHPENPKLLSSTCLGCI